MFLDLCLYLYLDVNMHVFVSEGEGRFVIYSLWFVVGTGTRVKYVHARKERGLPMLLMVYELVFLRELTEEIPWVRYEMSLPSPSQNRDSKVAGLHIRARVGNECTRMLVHTNRTSSSTNIRRFACRHIFGSCS